MRQHNDQSFKDLIASFVTEQKLEPKLLESKVAENWATIVGELIANHTDKLFIREGVLNLYISSAPLRQELSYQKQKIAELVNEFLGQEFIEQVVVR